MNTPYTLDSLTTLLSANDADVSLYGTGEAKTLAHLLKEVNGGEVALEISDGRLLRKAIVITVEVWFGQFRLTEDRQVFTDGRVRNRKLTALAEKATPGESYEDAARRGMTEELGFAEVLSLEFLEEKVSVKESPSYPGLASEYTVVCFKAEISSEQYRPEGYVENQPDKSTYFVWKNVK
jgi:hypothetical protein